jgi:hypothetical protein
MANLTWKTVVVKLSNASGSLTDISCNTNSYALRATLDMLDDTTLCNDNRSYVSGMPSVTLPLAGPLNSTIYTIISPLLNGTSIPKTFEILTRTGAYLNGSCWPQNVEISGAAGQLQMWSMDALVDGTINRTSVGL